MLRNSRHAFCLRSPGHAPYDARPTIDLQGTVTIPEKLKNRISALAKEDADIREYDRRTYEDFCLRQHHRRIWQKLAPAERTIFAKENPKAAEHEFIDAVQLQLTGKSVSVSKNSTPRCVEAKTGCARIAGTLALTGKHGVGQYRYAGNDPRAV